MAQLAEAADLWAKLQARQAQRGLGSPGKPSPVKRSSPRKDEIDTNELRKEMFAEEKQMTNTNLTLNLNLKLNLTLTLF